MDVGSASDIPAFRQHATIYSRLHEVNGLAGREITSNCERKMRLPAQKAQ
jgi:hypothetical protein